MTELDWKAEEKILCEAYQQEVILYQQAVQKVEEILETISRETPPHDLVGQLVRIVEQTRTLEAGIASTKQRWHDRGIQPGPSLRPLLAQTRTLIQQLIEKVDKAREQASTRQMDLMSELDWLARGRQMQRVYGNTLGG